jgi:hypothetical protein
MTVVVEIITVWFGLNLLIPAFIYYQRTPSFRHRVFRTTFGLFAFPSERRLAHTLVYAAHQHR